MGGYWGYSPEIAIYRPGKFAQGIPATLDIENYALQLLIKSIIHLITKKLGANEIQKCPKHAL